MPDKERCSYILIYIYKMYAMIFIKISSFLLKELYLYKKGELFMNK